MKLTLYTCESGKYLYGDGDWFIAWEENEYRNHIDSDEELYIFDVNEEDVIRIVDGDYTKYRVEGIDVTFSRAF